MSLGKSIYCLLLLFYTKYSVIEAASCFSNSDLLTPLLFTGIKVEGFVYVSDNIVFVSAGIHEQSFLYNISNNQPLKSLDSEMRVYEKPLLSMDKTKVLFKYADYSQPADLFGILSTQPPYDVKTHIIGGIPEYFTASSNFEAIYTSVRLYNGSCVLNMYKNFATLSQSIPIRETGVIVLSNDEKRLYVSNSYEGYQLYNVDVNYDISLNFTVNDQDLYLAVKVNDIYQTIISFGVYFGNINAWDPYMRNKTGSTRMILASPYETMTPIVSPDSKTMYVVNPTGLYIFALSYSGSNSTYSVGIDFVGFITANAITGSPVLRNDSLLLIPTSNGIVSYNTTKPYKPGNNLNASLLTSRAAESMQLNKNRTIAYVSFTWSAAALDLELRIYSISPSGQFDLLKGWNLPNRVKAMKLSIDEERLYYCTDGVDDLYYIEGLTNLVTVSNVPTWNHLYEIGNLLYIPTITDGLYVLNLSTPLPYDKKKILSGTFFGSSLSPTTNVLSLCDWNVTSYLQKSRVLRYDVTSGNVTFNLSLEDHGCTGIVQDLVNPNVTYVPLRQWGNGLIYLVESNISIIIPKKAGFYNLYSKMIDSWLVSTSEVYGILFQQGSGQGASFTEQIQSISTLGAPGNNIFIDTKNGESVVYVPTSYGIEIHVCQSGLKDTVGYVTTSIPTTSLVASSTSSSSPASTTTTGGSNIAPIAGGAAAGGVVLIILVVVIIFVILRKKKSTQENLDRNDSFSPSKDVELALSNPTTPKYSLLDEVEVGRRLGGGNFGVVYKGIWQGTTEVALKQLKDASQFKEFTQEASILETLRHPNIVQCLGVYVSPSKEQYIVTEFLSEGDLISVLRKQGKKMKFIDLIAIVSQAAAGMSYLEKSKVIHRDLSGRNILVALQGETFVAKVADFGLSRTVETDVYTSNSNTIPIRWSAPESIEYGTFSSSSDVWSFGIVMWEIFSLGMIPYSEYSNVQVVQKVKSGYRLGCPQDCPEDVYRLMKKCWEVKSEDRPTFSELFIEIKGILQEWIDNNEVKTTYNNENDMKKEDSFYQSATNMYTS